MMTGCSSLGELISGGYRLFAALLYWEETPGGSLQTRSSALEAWGEFGVVKCFPNEPDEEYEMEYIEA